MHSEEMDKTADLPIIDDLHAAFRKIEQLYSKDPSTYLPTDFPLFTATIGDVSEGVVS